MPAAQLPFPQSDDPATRAGRRYVAHVDGQALTIHLADQTLLVGLSGTSRQSRWHLHEWANTLILEWYGPCSDGPDAPELLAALEASFIFHPERTELELATTQLPSGFRDSIVTICPEHRLRVTREVLWQQPRLWLPQARSSYALRYTMTNGSRHPLRPAKPSGTVYQRFIPWLGKTLSLRTVNCERDLVVFNRWMNDPTVAQFWQEEGDVAKHRTYLERIDADPHVIGLMGCFDNEPFGYFEVYWAKEDRIAPFYDADDYDRGWHVLIGEKKFRGKPFVTAWMPSISHYLFLDDCRTQRIVIEPRVDNQKMRKSLTRSGYALLKEFDFPHKRAALGVLLRETQFSDQTQNALYARVPTLEEVPRNHQASQPEGDE